MMEFYDRRFRKAKKEHRCEMCHKTIEVGEEYCNETGKYDGDFFERKMHSNCFNMFQMMLDDMGDYEFTWDCFSDWWMDNKCSVCKFQHPICNPDENCRYSPSDCLYKIKGRCISDDDCTDLTHIGWCEKFEPEEEEGVYDTRQRTF